MKFDRDARSWVSQYPAQYSSSFYTITSFNRKGTPLVYYQIVPDFLFKTLNPLKRSVKTWNA